MPCWFDVTARRSDSYSLGLIALSKLLPTMRPSSTRSTTAPMKGSNAKPVNMLSLGAHGQSPQNSRTNNSETKNSLGHEHLSLLFVLLTKIVWSICVGNRISMHCSLNARRPTAVPVPSRYLAYRPIIWEQPSRQGYMAEQQLRRQHKLRQQAAGHPKFNPRNPEACSIQQPNYAGSGRLAGPMTGRH